MNGIWILRHATLGMRLILCRSGATLDNKNDIAALEAAGWEVSYSDYNVVSDTETVRNLVGTLVRDGEDSHWIRGRRQRH
jgi:hypothetical protein